LRDTSSQPQTCGAAGNITLIIHDLREIAEPGRGRELFLIGGAQLYGELLQKCPELFLTLVKREVAGDTFFPPFESAFRLWQGLRLSCRGSCSICLAREES